MRERVFLVGGGYSLQGFNFSRLRNEDTIVVNKSIFDVPSPNYFITVDYTFLRKININQFKLIKTTKVFVADFSYSFLKERNGQIVDMRKSNFIYDLNVFNLIIKSYKAEGIGYSFGDFRTGLNSGYCALQLAVVLGYKEIILLGFDLNISDATHYHKGYGEGKDSFKQKLEKYYNYFGMGLGLLTSSNRGIKVYSCSSNSKLNNIIPYCSVKEILG